MNRGTAFWDSSALIPLCVQERTSNKVRALAREFAPIVWWATVVEIHSAIARLYRSGEVTDGGQKAAWNRLTVLSQGWREVLPSDKLRDQARGLLDMYLLRAADAMQLASALIWCQQQTEGRAFISSDVRLCDAARRAGFSVRNPAETV